MLIQKTQNRLKNLVVLTSQTPISVREGLLQIKRPGRTISERLTTDPGLKSDGNKSPKPGKQISRSADEREK